MKTETELREWLHGAEAALGDPSKALCQLFFLWSPILLPDGAALEGSRADLLRCYPEDDHQSRYIVAEVGNAVFPIPITPGPMEASVEEVITYHVEKIVPGVWAMTPSLNVEGLLHAFLVFYGVPDPAPWEVTPSLILRP